MSAGVAEQLLTAEELEALMIELAYRAGPEPFDDRQAAALVGWAEETRKRQRLLERLLAQNSEITAREMRRD